MMKLAIGSVSYVRNAAMNACIVKFKSFCTFIFEKWMYSQYTNDYYREMRLCMCDKIVSGALCISTSSECSDYSAPYTFYVYVLIEFMETASLHFMRFRLDVLFVTYVGRNTLVVQTVYIKRSIQYIFYVN